MEYHTVTMINNGTKLCIHSQANHTILTILQTDLNIQRYEHYTENTNCLSYKKSGESANAVPHYQKLCSRDSHIWGIRSGQHSRSAMAEPRPGWTTFLIMVSPLPGKYELYTFGKGVPFLTIHFTQRGTTFYQSLKWPFLATSANQITTYWGKSGTNMSTLFFRISRRGFLHFPIMH